MLSTKAICSDYMSGKNTGKCAEPCKVTFDIGNVTIQLIIEKEKILVMIVSP
mgnify:CR=1 FL=1